MADITTDAERIIDKAIQHFGKINVLVNNAGIHLPKKYHRLHDGWKFDRVMNTVVILFNLKSRN